MDYHPSRSPSSAPDRPPPQSLSPSLALPPPLPNNPLSFPPRPRASSCDHHNCHLEYRASFDRQHGWERRACEGLGARAELTPETQFALRKYVEYEDANVLVVTEAYAEKAFEKKGEWDFLEPRYPYRYWKGDGKVAVFSKIEPLNVVYGFPNGSCFKDLADAESRCITLEFEKTFILGTYVPNSGQKCANIGRREEWNSDFAIHIRSLDAVKPVIWTGDFNVALETTAEHSNDIELDTLCFKQRAAGTNPSERASHKSLLYPPWLEHPRRPATKFVDVWRLIHGPDAREWTHKGRRYSRSNGSGWRIDGMIVSQRLVPRVRRCEIRHQVREVFGPDAGRDLKAPSDYWPVWMSMEGSL